MQKFKVDIERNLVDSHHSDEEYGDWSESYSNTFRSITLDDKIEYPDISSTLEFAAGEQVYVVWVEYSYGDSFGHAHCVGSEPVAIFKDSVSAYELKTAIQKQDTSSRDWNTKYLLKLKTSDGQQHEFSTSSWHDYFGGLEGIYIEGATLEGNYE